MSVAPIRSGRRRERVAGVEPPKRDRSRGELSRAAAVRARRSPPGLVEILIVIAGLGAAVASPAIGIVILGYGFAARHMAIRRRERLQTAHHRALALEKLSAVAADARAGATPAPFTLRDRELERMARAARRLSDRTGSPLADLLERLESHHLALSRVDSAAEAQAAGTRLTGALLTALPFAALGLGHAIGVDPIGVLVSSKAGIVCVAVAVVLQLTGFAWTDRLARPRADRSRSLTELAVAADLLSVTLRAGLPVGVAVTRVGEALEGPLSAQLVQIGRELQAGIAPKQAWQRLAVGGSGRAALPDPARRVVNAAQRTADSGAAMSGALSRCADDIRTDAAHARQAHAQRMGVLLVFPLGLCFLPAFMFGGLAPVVLAVLAEVL